MALKFTRLSLLAFSPIRATDKSAGVDLVTPVDFVVPSWGKQRVFLDLAFEMPPSTYGRIAARSGLVEVRQVAKFERKNAHLKIRINVYTCLLYTSPSPRDRQKSRMPSSA